MNNKNFVKHTLYYIRWLILETNINNMPYVLFQSKVTKISPQATEIVEKPEPVEVKEEVEEKAEVEPEPIQPTQPTQPTPPPEVKEKPAAKAKGYVWNGVYEKIVMKMFCLKFWIHGRGKKQFLKGKVGKIYNIMYAI